MLVNWLKRMFYNNDIEKYSSQNCVSDNYELIGETELSRLPSSVLLAWQDTQIPNRQRQLVDAQLDLYKKGSKVEPFDVFSKLLSKINNPLTSQRLLEIGCSSGYYSEVIKFSDFNIDYTGCDYSESFIELAKQYYPECDFFVADASNLKIFNRSYDIVVSGCCILHMTNYEEAISEVARVADKWAIFHRTPVLVADRTQYFTKDAYGIKTVEIHFNEPNLINLFNKYGLAIVDVISFNQEYDGNGNILSATRSYLLKKTGL